MTGLRTRLDRLERAAARRHPQPADVPLTDEDIERQREGEQDPRVVERRNGLPAALPSTCRLIGSWNVGGGQAPGVMVVEAESFADLLAINQHWAGYLQFDWHPTTTGGVPRG